MLPVKSQIPAAYGGLGLAVVLVRIDACASHCNVNGGVIFYVLPDTVTIGIEGQKVQTVGLVAELDAGQSVFAFLVVLASGGLGGCAVFVDNVKAVLVAVRVTNVNIGAEGYFTLLCGNHRAEGGLFVAGIQGQGAIGAFGNA